MHRFPSMAHAIFLFHREGSVDSREAFGAKAGRDGNPLFEGRFELVSDGTTSFSGKNSWRQRIGGIHNARGKADEFCRTMGGWDRLHFF